MTPAECEEQIAQLLVIHRNRHGHPELSEYRSTLVVIGHEICALDAGLTWACEPGERRSRTEWTFCPTGRTARVWLNTAWPSGKELMFHLIHEFGHVIANNPPEPNKPDKETVRYEKEEQAWRLGWERALSLIPDLAGHEEAFVQECNRCLGSYVPKA